MNHEKFLIQEAINEFGIDKLRILYPSARIQYSLPNIMLSMSAGMILANDNDPTDMVLHTIDQESWKANPGYKIKLNPEDRYNQFCRNPVNGEAIDIPMYLPTSRLYVGDFENQVEKGKASIYAINEDGYSLVFSVVKEITSEEDLKVIAWADNVLNSMPFHG